MRFRYQHTFVCYLLVLWEGQGCVTTDIQDLLIPLLSRLINICRMDAAERFFRYRKTDGYDLNQPSSDHEVEGRLGDAQDIVTRENSSLVWERAPEPDSSYWKASGDAFCVQAAACVWKVCEGICDFFSPEHSQSQPSNTTNNLLGAEHDCAVQLVLSTVDDGEMLCIGVGYHTVIIWKYPFSSNFRD